MPESRSSYGPYGITHVCSNSIQTVRSFWDQSHQPFDALSRALSTPKMAPFSRVAKYQNSSKSHLFQKLENTLISR